MIRLLDGRTCRIHGSERMTIREVIVWLKQYRHIQREIRDIELRITKLRLQYAAPSAISYSDMPKAHDSEHDLSDYYAKLEEYESLLIERHTECLGLSVQYIQACECLDREEAHVIKRAYMDGAKWLQIAHEIPCSESTVYRLRKQAIRKLADNIDVKRRQ